MLASPRHKIKTLPGRVDMLALAQRFPCRYPYLLESTAQSLSTTSNTSRYDILMAFPQQELRKTWQGELLLDNKALPDKQFLPALNTLYQSTANTECSSLPFSGGWFLYLGYELVSEIEPGLHFPQQEQVLPLALARRIPAAIIYDHTIDATHLVAEKDFDYCLDYMADDLNLIEPTLPTTQPVSISLIDDDPQTYIAGVARVLDYIREGDVFQVNLSRQWTYQHHGQVKPLEVYKKLRVTNPAPFSACVLIDDVAILSSSPERLVCVRDGKIETRPIAGTRPRSPDTRSDEKLQAELIANLKERAEHVMLIDLERNDLGRVCVPGSIQVDEMMVIESYAHVHHIVSNVSGQLREEIGPGEIIAAVFPGGTITGCPKVRCMEIIHELEQTVRGAYTGSIGYLNHNGDMDLNILIRSIVIDAQAVTLRAGAGLVADSVPAQELEETRSKAKGMLLALTE